MNRRTLGIFVAMIGVIAAAAVITFRWRHDPKEPDLKPPESKQMSGYVCASCGQYHEGLILTFAFGAPEAYYQVPERERESGVEMTDDTCLIDGKHFFIRGLIEIPIVGSDEKFAWSVWVSLSEKNYLRTTEVWETPGRESEPPQFGWLSNSIPIYPETLNLKTNVHTRPVGQRPFVELEPTEHPLAREQREGISRARVEEINSALHHLVQ